VAIREGKELSGTNIRDTAGTRNFIPEDKLGYFGKKRRKRIY